jgi:formylglycine-generating enzyme required for sulfatase activity
MGSGDEDVLAGSDERPPHEVTLDNFYIDKYEVTVAQYAVFLNRLGTYDNACDHLDCALPQQIAGETSYLLEQDFGDGTIQYLPVTGFAKYPANHVSWFGANAYCQAMGARLPTEAEWEYAARGDDGRIYPWGNSAPNPTRAVYQSQSFENLKPVDALPEGASPFGVYGLAGSVWEWVADWYGQDYYSLSPAVNPTGPESGLTRVIRGGAWPANNQADRIRAANRSSITPDFLSSTIGFRCASTP